MLITHYMDVLDDTGQIDMTALRCTSCGEVVDPVILQNRVSQEPNLKYGAKQRKYGQQVDREKAPGQTDHGGESGTQESQ